MKLIVGLGNPGPQYAETRHNIGFMVAQMLAERCGISLKKQGHQALYGVGRICGQEAMILLPQTFMNRSGGSVGSVCRTQGVTPEDIVVIHDDIDLPFGYMKIKSGGGHGGHNGIRHIREVLGTGDFFRVKIGVDRPPAGGEVSGYVLQRFNAAERQKLEAVLVNSALAVETLISKGGLQAMNEFNNRDISI